jgi:hypothetical protein
MMTWEGSEVGARRQQKRKGVEQQLKHKTRRAARAADCRQASAASCRTQAAVAAPSRQASEREAVLWARVRTDATAGMQAGHRWWQRRHIMLLVLRGAVQLDRQG